MPWSKDNLPENVQVISKKEKWTDSQILSFVKSANSALREYKDKGKAISAGIATARDLQNEGDAKIVDRETRAKNPSSILKTKETQTMPRKPEDQKQNAKEWPKSYTAKFIEPGLVGYGKIINGKPEETLLVKNEALQKMAETFKGKPVVVLHKDVNPENIKELSGGYVSVARFNDDDAYWYADFIAIDDDANKKISQGWSVSCAYIPTEFGPGGVHNNVPYDREVLNGEYLHLALVDNPRYEDAKIYENSEKKQEKKFMFKIFQNKKEEVKASLENSVVEIEEGKEVPLSELVNSYKNAEDEKKKKEEDEKKNEKNTVGLDDEVEIDGKMVKVKEMAKAYKSACEKKNQEDEDGKKEEDEKKDAEKKNALEQEEKTKEEQENFKTLENAKNKAINGPVVAQKIETIDAKIQRGKELY